jgi:predicted ferric reductase
MRSSIDLLNEQGRPTIVSSLRGYIKPGDFLLLGVLIPLALAWSRLSHRFGDDLGDSLLMVGRASGILGLTMVLAAGILSVRVPQLDRPFGGLTRLWKLHHMLGFSGFILIFTHVELIAVSALPISRELPAEILFPSLHETDVWLGWLALIGLTIFLAPSFKFFGPPDYQAWKLIHMVTAPTALLLATLHATGLSPEGSIWWAIGGMAAFAVAWRRFGSRLAGRLRYTVESIERLAPDVVEISLRPEGKPLRYEAGQFVYVTATDPALAAGRFEEHPFSVSSSPHEEVLRLGIKDFGDASHALQQISPGSAIWIEGPYGDFFAQNTPNHDELWLGGGIGITPMVGGVRALASVEAAPSRKVHLFYLADSAERAYYREVLIECARRVDGLELTEHYFRQEGVMTPDYLQAHCPDFREREVYLCGPPPMLTHFRNVLKSQGVPGSRIHSEEFTFL